MLAQRISIISTSHMVTVIAHALRIVLSLNMRTIGNSVGDLTSLPSFVFLCFVVFNRTSVKIIDFSHYFRFYFVIHGSSLMTYWTPLMGLLFGSGVDLQLVLFAFLRLLLIIRLFVFNRLQTMINFRCYVIYLAIELDLMYSISRIFGHLHLTETCTILVIINR